MDNEVQVGAVDPAKAKEMAAEAKALAKAKKEAERAAAAQAKADEKAKAKAEKEAAVLAEKAAAEAEKAVKPAKLMQNGQTRPAAGTTTVKVWDIADAISARNKVPAERAEVLKEAEAQGVNAATAATQYSRWCLFHGVKKVREATTPVQAPETNTEVAEAA